MFLFYIYKTVLRIASALSTCWREKDANDWSASAPIKNWSFCWASDLVLHAEVLNCPTWGSKLPYLSLRFEQPRTYLPWRQGWPKCSPADVAGLQTLSFFFIGSAGVGGEPLKSSNNWKAARCRPPLLFHFLRALNVLISLVFEAWTGCRTPVKSCSECLWLVFLMIIYKEDIRHFTAMRSSASFITWAVLQWGGKRDILRGPCIMSLLQA